MKPAARHLLSVAQVGNLPFRRLAVGTAADRSRACGLPIRDTADCQSALRSIARTRSVERAFTMIEIALSIAVVAFALVAIMGVLPTGLNVQRDNREETIINQDAAYILQALRSGTTNLDSFMRNVEMIQITNTLSAPAPLPLFNGMENPLLSAHPNTTPEMLLSFLTTRKKRPYVEEALAIARSEQPGLITNVTARIRAFSGPLADRGDSATARELAFTYLLFCEIIPYDAYPTNVINDAIKDVQANPKSGQTNIIKTAQVQGHNLYEVRLEFRWPVLPDPANNNNTPPDKPNSLGLSGSGRLVYRSLIAGSITNYPSLDVAKQAINVSRFAHQVYFNPLLPPPP